jgi:hypothetical protein
LAAWLECHSPQLDGFVLIANDTQSELLLSALASAAAAAQADGRPLRLRTLRVLRGQVQVGTAGNLLPALPHLRCLQLELCAKRQISWPAAEEVAPLGVEALAPLQAATQLEELYVRGPWLHDRIPAADIPPDALPPRLQRLSWTAKHGQDAAADLSHLTQLTFLQLGTYMGSRTPLRSSQLPPQLQQLELVGKWCADDVLEVLEEQPQLVTAWQPRAVTPWHPQNDEEVPQLLARLPNLTAISMLASEVKDCQAALEQLPKLSTMTVTMKGRPIGAPPGWQPPVDKAVGVRSLRCLHLNLQRSSQPPEAALTALTALTKLMLFGLGFGNIRSQQQDRQQQQERRQEQERRQLQEQGQGQQQQQQQQQGRGRVLRRQYHWQRHYQVQPDMWSAWAGVLGRMAGLQWLSIPDVLLGGEWSWLRGLQQLRVLVVHSRDCFYGDAPATSLPWLEECSQEALPPQLQVLGVSGMTAEQAASWQVRRRLQQLVGSSGCEVVVGVDLDEGADPTQQLAGLPAALQQVLA